MKQFILPAGYNGETQFSLEDTAFHHLVRVRRVKPGDTLKGIDEKNRRYTFQVDTVRGDSCLLNRVASEEPQVREHHITLFQCLLKGKKFSQVVRQATEAGAERIVPVISEYSIPRPEGRDDKIERLRKIAREAVEQSGSPVIPEITVPVHIRDIPSIWDSGDTALYFRNIPANTVALHARLRRPGKNLALFIGPEGGISDTDKDVLEASGFHPVYLGENTLRSETAALYALGALNILLMEKETWTVKQPS